MPVDKKIIERVDKLMRLAAPSSGGSEHERTSAALEAARLFSEHNLVAREKEAKRRVRAPRATAPWQPSSSAPWQQPPNPVAGPGATWARATAAQEATCADPTCQGEINRGQPVWRRLNGFKVEYIHADGTCGW